MTTATLRPAPAIPTAGWSLRSLMRHLHRRGCPALRGRANSAARTALLAAYATTELQGTDRWSGQITTTAAQLAEVAGVSDKTILRGLRELEARGLIRWHRGGVRYRSPRPSVIVLSRRALAALLATAGDDVEQREQARALVTTARLQALRTPHLDPSRKRRWPRPSVSGHEGLPLPKEGEYGRPSPGALWETNPAPPDVAVKLQGLISALRTKGASTKRWRRP